MSLLTSCDVDVYYVDMIIESIERRWYIKMQLICNLDTRLSFSSGGDGPFGRTTVRVGWKTEADYYSIGIYSYYIS